MTANDAAKLCEEDGLCAGFTFHGVLVEDVEFDVHFFSYVSKIHFYPSSSEFWEWTSYKVNRDFVIIPGMLIGYDWQSSPTMKAPVDILTDPAEA